MRKFGVFSDPKFLRELHHFLWVAPFVNSKGEHDAGWGCRDHALVVAGIIAVMKSTSAHMTGKMLVHIPSVAQLRIEVDAHTYLMVEGFGYIDLSIRLESVLPDIPWRPACVLGRQCWPDGRVKRVLPGEQADALQGAERSKMPHIIYVRDKVGRLAAEDLEAALDFTNSPLADRLRDRYDNGIYSRLIRHLYLFLRGEEASLTYLGQDEAWARLAEGKGNPIQWVLTRANL